jgi:DNA-binding XRE family transcriptional regulator
MKLSEFVKLQRAKKGLSQYQLSKLVENYPASVYHLEKGKSDKVIKRINECLKPLGYKFKLVPIDDGKDSINVPNDVIKPVKELEVIREEKPVNEVKELTNKLPERWKVAPKVAPLTDKAAKLQLAKQALQKAVKK